MPISVSIKERISQAATVDQDMRLTIEALAADVIALRASLAALTTAYNATLAKLDADAANTALNDTNYAATNPGVAPAALNVSA